MRQRVTNMKRVLFVCTGNTCRSPMAMAWFNRLAKETGLEWVADSAGLAAYGDPVSANAILALKSAGIEPFAYVSKRVNPQHIEESDWIVTMTNQHKSVLQSVGVSEDKILVLGEGISDPYGGDVDDYALCLEQIARGIDALIDGGYFS